MVNISNGTIWINFRSKKNKLRTEKKLELTILKKDQINLDEEIAWKAKFNSRKWKRYSKSQFRIDYFWSFKIAMFQKMQSDLTQQLKITRQELNTIYINKVSNSRNDIIWYFK